MNRSRTVVISSDFNGNYFMTTQRNNKRNTVQVNTSSAQSIAFLSAEKVKLFAIAVKMKKAELADSFIVDAVRTALEFEGVADLMNLWVDEEDKKIRDEIVADIQEMIDECTLKEKVEEIYVKFNDLDAIAKNIRAFKDRIFILKTGG
jgi:hypothetical protein